MAAQKDGKVRERKKSNGTSNKRKLDDYDLPITVDLQAKKPKKNNNKSGKSRLDTSDDVPKDFARLMRMSSSSQPSKQQRKLDAKPWLRRKNNAVAAAAGSSKAEAKELPFEVAKVRKGATENAVQTLLPLPGEKLSDFNRRVDTAIPVTLKGASRPARSKLQQQQQKAAAAEEDGPNSDEDMSDDYDFDDEGDPLPPNMRKYRKKHSHQNKSCNRKRSKSGRRSASPEFTALESAKPKVGGISDVATAPPNTLAKPKEKLRSLVDSVPKSTGSLAKRQAIAEDRLAVIARYREMMSERRESGNNAKSR